MEFAVPNSFGYMQFQNYVNVVIIGIKVKFYLLIFQI